ncbi:MAG: hypothetical protein IPL94_08830 [Tetrasphaera sp.]|nr:hypothetical protein [Tetrasphaera sp.]
MLYQLSYAHHGDHTTYREAGDRVDNGDHRTRISGVLRTIRSREDDLERVV